MAVSVTDLQFESSRAPPRRAGSAQPIFTLFVPCCACLRGLQGSVELGQLWIPNDCRMLLGPSRIFGDSLRLGVKPINYE